MDLNRILNIIREEMMNTDPGRTQQTGFSSKADDPVAGYDSVMDLRSKYGKKLNLFYRKRLQKLKKDARKQYRSKK
tara:strand:- start:2057 stop:2284 length:228 start_codon:yes stop_codon:yes gene_type:complete